MHIYETISYPRIRKKLILLKEKLRATGYLKKGASIKDPFRGPIYSVSIRIWLITYSMKSMKVFMEVIPGVDPWPTEQCPKGTGGHTCRVILFGM